MGDYSIYTEDQLVYFLQEGNEAAFEEIYFRYKDKLFFYVLQLTESPQKAEDVLQDVFVKIWLNRASLNRPANIGAWIFTVARNHVFDAMRRAAKESMVLNHLKTNSIAGHESTEQNVFYNDLQAFISTAVNKLPPQQKLVFTLSREQGLMHDEIANELNISPKTVRKHLQQALRFLKESYLTHHQYLPPVLLSFLLGQ